MHLGLQLEHHPISSPSTITLGRSPIIISDQRAAAVSNTALWFAFSPPRKRTWIENSDEGGGDGGSGSSSTVRASDQLFREPPSKKATSTTRRVHVPSGIEIVKFSETPFRAEGSTKRRRGVGYGSGRSIVESRVNEVITTTSFSSNQKNFLTSRCNQGDVQITCISVIEIDVYIYPLDFPVTPDTSIDDLTSVGLETANIYRSIVYEDLFHGNLLLDLNLTYQSKWITLTRFLVSLYLNKSRLSIQYWVFPTEEEVKGAEKPKFSLFHSPSIFPLLYIV